jgi:hypothetical protein
LACHRDQDQWHQELEDPLDLALGEAPGRGGQQGGEGSGVQRGPGAPADHGDRPGGQGGQQGHAEHPAEGEQVAGQPLDQ